MVGGGNPKPDLMRRRKFWRCSCWGFESSRKREITVEISSRKFLGLLVPGVKNLAWQFCYDFYAEMLQSRGFAELKVGLMINRG